MDMIASAAEACKWGYSAFGLQPYAAVGVDNLVNAVARAWCERTSIIRLVEKTLPRQCIAIRYEALVTNPVAAATEISKFLHLEFDERMISVGFEEPRMGGHGDHKIHDHWTVSLSSLGRGSVVPVDHLTDAGLAHMNTLLADLDYPLVDRGWNHAPSPFRRGIATPHDYGILRNFFEGHVASNLRGLPLAVAPQGFTLRVIVEECAGGESWVLDASRRTVQLEPEDVETHAVLVTRATALLAVASGYVDVAKAHEDGDIRDGSDRRYENSQGSRLLGLVLSGYERTRYATSGAFCFDLSTRGGSSARR